jgi:L-threonylcarbamoyladenylate synthase
MTVATQDLERVKRALSNGGIVAVPTDTVYGVAALVAEPDACRAIFELKERPDGVSLPVLVANLEQAFSFVEETDRAFRALSGLWPGPLTIVTRRAPGVSAVLGGDEATIGLRWPAHALMRELAHDLGPLATTSANKHGRRPATTPEEVDASFGTALELVYDGGRCEGQPSTVVSLTGGELEVLREGPISERAIRERLAAGEIR